MIDFIRGPLKDFGVALTAVAFVLLVLALFSPSECEAAQRKQPVTADEYCMAINVYYEARFEPEKGMRGVAYVTLNRHRHRHQSVCHVVFAYKQFSWVRQYQVLNEQRHIKDEFRPKGNDKRWIACLQLARDVIAHPGDDFTKNAEYFVASYIFPRCLTHNCGWIRNLEFTGQYGVHLFFADKVKRREDV